MIGLIACTAMGTGGRHRTRGRTDKHDISELLRTESHADDTRDNKPYVGRNHPGGGLGLDDVQVQKGGRRSSNPW